MKKSNLLSILFTLSIALGGCNFASNSSSTNKTSSTNKISSTNNSSTKNSSQSSSSVEIITGVDIVGPTSVLVGKKITLTADVIGSDNDDVNWTSSDSNIATIDGNGEVTGISEGSVEICATSVKDPTKSNTITINVTLAKAENIDLFIEESDNVIYNESQDSYTVLLGQTFYINTTFSPNNSKAPDISYSFLYPDGSEYNSLVSMEIEPDSNRAKIISFAEIDGIVIKAKGTYNDMTGNDYLDSIVVNVIDKNITELNNVLDKVNSFKTNELNSLVSSTLTRTKTTTNGSDTIKVNENIEHNSYKNATYVNKETKTYTNNNLTNQSNHKYYQGVQMLNNINHYYAFEYDNNNKIIKFIDNINENDVATSTSFNDYITKTSLIMDVNSTINYGYTDILLNILNSQSTLYEGDLAPFLNPYVYAYSEYKLENSKYTITSTCFDDDHDVNYNLSIEINFENDKLLGYTFTEEVTNGDVVIQFTEEAKNLVYSSKVNDSIENTNYLDLNQYYVNDFEVVEFNEKKIVDNNVIYDYSNTKKYGADIVSEVNGLTKYTASYDKAIVLKANTLSPNTADINFDIIQCSSSNSNVIPSVESVHDGIFVINAKKDPQTAKRYTGEATFTFTSSLGYEQKVIIEFVEAVLKGVTVNIPSVDTLTDNYKFDLIFENELSSYFYINANPDESKYEFAINIISGDQNGIELYQYEDNNPYGYPGFSYAIKGVKAGTYSFEIYVIGYNSIKCSTVFEIEVAEPYSVEFIEQNIVGKTYSYKGATSEYLFKFESSTSLKYTQNDYGSTVTKTFNYRIEKGAIIIDNIQSFDSNMYYSRINSGNIIFSKDFKTINISLEIYDSNRLEGASAFFYHEFTYLPDPISISNLNEYLNGKTLYDNYNLVKVTFNNGEGCLYFYNYGGELLATITFNYSVANNTFIVTNSISDNENYSIIDDKCGFDEYNQVIEFRINNNLYDYYDNYKVSLF